MSLAPTQSIARRLAIGLGGLVCFCVAGAALSALLLQSIGSRMQRIVRVNDVAVSRAALVRNSVDQLGILARNATLLSEASMIKAEVEKIGRQQAQWQVERRQLGQAVAAEGDPALDALASDLDARGTRLVAMIREAADQGAEGASVEATLALMERVRPAEDAWRARMDELRTRVTQANDTLVDATLAAQRRLQWCLAGFAIAAASAGTLLGVRLVRGIQQPIAEAVAVAQRIAAGDLAGRIDIRRADEIGRLLAAMDQMRRQLRELVTQIRDASDSITTASAEVASGNQDLSRRTELASNNLQQTASAMSALTTSVQDSAEAARQARALAEAASDVAGRGGSVVADVVATMNEIDGSSKRIADIIGVIDGIAFQTSILALNAGVEAARAGDQGRGFAVVAGEVRSLARRSAEAACEIKSLIEHSVERVEAGTRLVGVAGTTMREIQASVQRVTGIIADISHTSGAQSHDIGQVGAAVVQLDAMTQQNAALVEQGAAAAESLREQADRLNRLVQSFHVGAAEDGASRDSTGAATEDDAARSDWP